MSDLIEKNEFRPLYEKRNLYIGLENVFLSRDRGEYVELGYPIERRFHYVILVTFLC